MSSIQEEIKQTKPFPNLRVEAMVSLVRTAAVLNHAFNEFLKPFAITITQYNVLRILRGAGETGLCGREIGDRLISPVPDVTRLLDRMDEMKLLVRVRSTEDRRYVSAHITQEGRKLLELVDPRMETIANQRFGHLDPDSLSGLITKMESLR